MSNFRFEKFNIGEDNLKSSEHEILMYELENSENEQFNTSYWDVQTILRFIVNGDTVALSRQLNKTFIDSFYANGGRVSDDPGKKLEYLSVIAIHRFGKAAVDGGLFPSEANRIADFYLRKLSACTSSRLYPDIIMQAAMHCCERVQASAANTPNYVKEVKNYVLTHLSHKIRLSDISESLHVSSSYLSKKFHKATGQTLSAYILSQKLEASTILLTYTSKPISEICAFLQFCNQSYYTKKFYETYHLTPKKYRLIKQNQNIYKDNTYR